MTAVQPPGRFGALRPRRRTARACATSSRSPSGDGGWMNGGFFVLEPAVLDYIDGDDDAVGAASRSSASRATASSPRTGTAASGSRWTRCATSAPSRSCGRAARRRGRRGDVRRRVRRPAGLRHRPHRLQGLVADAAGCCELGAEVTGYALEPPTEPSLFDALGLGERDATTSSATCATRDRLAARAGARRGRRSSSTWPRSRSCGVSYAEPRETFETNVMGTVNLLEAVARLRRGARRSSSSPATSATRTARRSRLPRGRRRWAAAIPTARARAAPSSSRRRTGASFFAATGRRGGRDRARRQRHRRRRLGARTASCPTACARWPAGEPVEVRNPDAVRPWQHVLEPLAGYLLARRAACCDDGARLRRARGTSAPPPRTARSPVRWVVERFVEEWGGGDVDAPAAGAGAAARGASALASTAARPSSELGWAPVWDAREAVRRDGGVVPAVYGADRRGARALSTRTLRRLRRRRSRGPAWRWADGRRDAMTRRGQRRAARARSCDLVGRVLRRRTLGRAAPFDARRDPVRYGGRVFGAEELDAARRRRLDFWLTARPLLRASSRPGSPTYLGVSALPARQLRVVGQPARVHGAHVAASSASGGCGRGDEVITVAAGFPTHRRADRAVRRWCRCSSTCVSDDYNVDVGRSCAAAVGPSARGPSCSRTRSATRSTSTPSCELCERARPVARSRTTATRSARATAAGSPARFGHLATSTLLSRRTT